MPTLKDVAALAGVSYQTASRVINNHANVLPSTRERVQSAIDALHYEPDEIARALQARRNLPQR